MDIECRIKGRQVSDGLGDQVLAIDCTVTAPAGLACVNRQQPAGSYCEDYEVRYKCCSQTGEYLLNLYSVIT